MRRAGLAGITGRPKWRHAKPDQIAADLVDRQFARSGPNQLWVTDITEHPTREGKLYCAVVLDTYSRRVVGWSIDASPTAALVTNALGMAIQTRTTAGGTVDPLRPGGAVRFLGVYPARQGLRPGALDGQSVGDCYDNAMIEAFWSHAGRAAEGAHCRSGAGGAASAIAHRHGQARIVPHPSRATSSRPCHIRRSGSLWARCDLAVVASGQLTPAGSSSLGWAVLGVARTAQPTAGVPASRRAARPSIRDREVAWR